VYMSPALLHPSLAIALLTVVAACSALTPPSGPTPGPTDLTGRTFLSTGVIENSTQRDLVRDTHIRVEFGNGQLGASAGCNLLGGPYELIDGRLVVGPIHATEMGCDPARHAQDEWLAAFLGAQPTIAVEDMTLVLEAGGTRITLADRRVVEPDLELVGPLWVLETIIDGEAASSVPPGVTASLRFDGAGHFEVDTGCNTGGGEYTIDDGQLTVGPIGLTRIGCPGVEGHVERVMLEVLTAPETDYSIEASSLTLDVGRLGLIFRGDG
jgi:heat shock protein HslJ